ncbi:hypothetical protein ACFWJ5_02905 [Streptomyces qaidamensis]
MNLEAEVAASAPKSSPTQGMFDQLERGRSHRAQLRLDVIFHRE